MSQNSRASNRSRTAFRNGRIVVKWFRRSDAVMAVLPLLAGTLLFYKFLDELMSQSAWFPPEWKFTAVVVAGVGASVMFSFLHVYPQLRKKRAKAGGHGEPQPRWILKPGLGAAITWFTIAIVALVLYIGLWSMCFRGTEHHVLVPAYFPEELARAIEARDGLNTVINNDQEWLQDQLNNVHTAPMAITSALFLLIYSVFVLAISAAFSLSFSVVDGLLERAGKLPHTP